MTKPSYPHQPLGKFIRAVDERNSSGAVTRLLGVSVSKCFIPSVANTIGTDMTKYKVVKKGQFACNLIHVGRDEVIPISLYDQEEDALLSSAYDVFEIINGTELLPEYLRLCVMRPEFDRYATFQAVYGIRGNLPWGDFCDIEIPVPPLAEQERIVSQFATIEERMRQCRERIALLERTATALYRKTFVEGLDRNDLPNGWRMGTLGEVAAFCYGKMPQIDKQGIVPVFSGYGIVGYTHQEMFKHQHIIVIARGDSGSGKVVLSPESFFLTNLSIAILLGRNAGMRYYLYHHLRELDTLSLRSGSAQAQITISSLEGFGVVIPPLALCLKYEELVKTLNKSMDNNQRQLACLEKLKAVLLTQIK